MERQNSEHYMTVIDVKNYDDDVKSYDDDLATYDDEVDAAMLMMNSTIFG